MSSFVTLSLSKHGVTLRQAQGDKKKYVIVENIHLFSLIVGGKIILGLLYKSMKITTKVQIIITIVFASLALIHIIWPTINVDSIFLILIILAIIPWIVPILKTLEFWGIKVEFQQRLDRVAKEINESGLVKEESNDKKNEYIFLDVAESDPRLSLAGLRIELEKSLKKLAEVNREDGFVESSRTSLARIMRQLSDNEILTHKEGAALADMIDTLNKAVHGEDIDYRATEWVLNIGPKVLNSINQKIEIAQKSR
ncbi:hypothetical protein COT97_03940 [Candidatus Falkowbacteria bacterium CG10_big_fil_rev_8_21_14_0_10_39_11]|uniref:DUF4145 domain-containing protein n=1 Tax=Candidatus Falkowbacteria bacterium CG10_big_fil_rev_8_21_14_0_10_39_11 TaxID=1974565 RepID=A0A2H0V4F0_9BACT|nr:MAG: hypothetical protein COT97_03940 [Candidatus Falkowbacteria bacterium CG10_big_fil_rev_8_21_14_0_10_39_11]